MKSKAFILSIFAYFLISFASYANLFAKTVADPVCSCNKGLADIVEELIPAVVNISSEQIVKQENNSRTKIPFTPRNNFFDDFREFFEHFDQFFDRAPSINREVTLLGSGFIIDKSEP